MSAPDGLSGQTVGGYRLGARLGQGGMGAVFRGEPVRGGPARAVKLLLEALDPELQARFRHEAEALGRLRHPGVVQLVDWGTDQGRPYLVMELIEGGSLHARLRKGPLAEDEAAGLVRELAGTLAVAHAQGIVHRDIKPANVLLRADGSPVLSDFGLVRMVGRKTRLTQTGEVLGTPAYMAPEQVTGDRERLGPATDIYALGVLLFECLTGELPFEGASAMELLEQVVHRAPPSPSSLRPGLDPTLARVCLRCLEKDPDRRWPSAEALAEALTPASRRAGLMWVAAAAWVALGLAVALGIVIGRGAAPPAASPPAGATPTASSATPAPPVVAATPTPARLPAWVEALPATQRPPDPLPRGLSYTERPFEVRSAVDGGALRWIPPGLARLPGVDPSEAHEVQVSGCFLGRYEVTWRQLRDFLASEGWASEAAQYQGSSGRLDRPALNARWGLAAAYCRWVGGRLPTEAEWRRAAYGDDGRSYPWGSGPASPAVARVGVGEDEGTLPAYAVPDAPSAWGCLGMGGNVAEWTQDWLAPLPERPGDDPRGPSRASLTQTQPLRVVMGSSYRGDAEQAHWRARRGAPPNGPRQQLFGSSELTDVGFRVCVPVGFVPVVPGPWAVEAYAFPPPRPPFPHDRPPPPGEPEALLARSRPFPPFEVQHLRFTWGARGPGEPDGGTPRCPGLPPDGFGLRARTRVRLPAGRWLLHTVSDDGIRVRLDGALVLEDWTHHADTALEHGFELTEARDVELAVDYFENFGHASLHVDVFPD